MKKEIIIKMPKDAEDIQVYKELSLDNGDSILIEVRENTFGEDATEEQSEPKVFFCYQDKVRKRFNPYDYSCIETTSNHYMRLHPINPKQEVLYIASRSLDVLLGQLVSNKVMVFIRVHASFAVNYNCIEDYWRGRLVVKGMRTAVPVAEQYKEELEKHICIIKYDEEASTK